MRLVKFYAIDGHPIFVNPDLVATVTPMGSNGCNVTMDNRMELFLSDSAEQVALQLSEGHLT